ncbi:hypothetical protein ACFZDJ_53950 [Streptomyces sp. NPDC007896]|uniref:hypothetical protein n=1 Tax=Streptomyces sp. NPDC007896 TaxID=3364784 RepID=UPI0036E71A84
MDAAAQNEGQDPLADRLIRAGAAFEGSAEIAEARAMARDFLTTVQAVHGLPVSERAMGMVQLVVSELVTNARKYARGPCSAPVSSSGGRPSAAPHGDSPTCLTGITEWVEILL